MRKLTITIIALAGMIAALGEVAAAQEQDREQPQAQRAPRGDRAAARQSRSAEKAAPSARPRVGRTERDAPPAARSRPGADRLQAQRRQAARMQRDRQADRCRDLARQLLRHIRQCPPGRDCLLRRQFRQQRLQMRDRGAEGPSLRQPPTRPGREMKRPLTRRGMRGEARKPAPRLRQSRLSKADREVIRRMIRQYLDRPRQQADGRRPQGQPDRDKAAKPTRERRGRPGQPEKPDPNRDRGRRGSRGG